MRGALAARRPACSGGDKVQVMRIWDCDEPTLKHSRWCLLNRPEYHTAKQTVKIAGLLQYNLRMMRGRLVLGRMGVTGNAVPAGVR